MSIKLFDESAEELVRGAARRHVEAHLEKAVEAARGQGSKKDPATVVAVRGVSKCGLGGT